LEGGKGGKKGGTKTAPEKEKLFWKRNTANISYALCQKKEKRTRLKKDQDSKGAKSPVAEGRLNPESSKKGKASVPKLTPKREVRVDRERAEPEKRGGRDSLEEKKKKGTAGDKARFKLFSKKRRGKDPPVLGKKGRQRQTVQDSRPPKGAWNSPRREKRGAVCRRKKKKNGEGLHRPMMRRWSSQGGKEGGEGGLHH